MKNIIASLECLKNPRTSFFIEMSLWSIALIIISFFVPLSAKSLNIFGVLTYSIAILLALRRYTLSEIGFRKNLSTTFIPWIVTSIAMVGIVYLLKSFYPNGVFTGFSKSHDELLGQLPFYIFFSAVLQEVVFRGYFYRRSSEVFSKNGAIISSIVIFSAFHLPYMVQLNSALFYFSIASGTIWSVVFAKYPNVCLAALSHSVVGASALLLLQRF